MLARWSIHTRCEKSKIFLDSLSKSGFLVRHYSEGRAASPAAGPGRRRKMPQYLISTYIPGDFDPSSVTEETIAAIHALNREMVAAGVRKFACGLSPKAMTLRSQSDGEVVVT